MRWKHYKKYISQVKLSRPRCVDFSVQSKLYRKKGLIPVLLNLWYKLGEGRVL